MYSSSVMGMGCKLTYHVPKMLVSVVSSLIVRYAECSDFDSQNVYIDQETRLLSIWAYEVSVACAVAMETP
jgi:hypothetical protein